MLVLPQDRLIKGFVTIVKEETLKHKEPLLLSQEVLVSKTIAADLKLVFVVPVNLFICIKQSPLKGTHISKSV